MNEKQPSANLAGMFIGGQVPFELVGIIFRAFYSAGINPKSFELAPIYSNADVNTAIEQMQKHLSNGAAPQITDQSSKPARKAKKAKRVRAPATTGMKAYLLALLNVSPRSRDEMRGLMEKQDQWQAKSLDARLHDIIAQKLSYRDADGIYHLTKLGQDAVAPKAEGAVVNGGAPKPVRTKKERGGGKTQIEFLLATLKTAHPESVALGKLTKLFKSKGFRPASASVALNVLKAKGQVERTAPAVYRFVKQQQETQANV